MSSNNDNVPPVFPHEDDPVAEDESVAEDEPVEESVEDVPEIPSVPTPVLEPVVNRDGVVQHTYEQYQQDLAFCAYALKRLKEVFDLDLFENAKQRLFKINAERRSHGYRKLGAFIYAYDIVGIWLIKYMFKGLRSLFPPINCNVDLDFLDRLLKLKLLLPDPFEDLEDSNNFCEVFGFNTHHYVDGYHRFLGEVDLYSEGLEDAFDSDEDSDPMTATLDRIYDLPSPGSSEASPCPFQRMSLFGTIQPAREYPDDPVDDSAVDDSAVTVGSGGDAPPCEETSGDSSSGTSSSDDGSPKKDDSPNKGDSEGDSDAFDCDDVETLNLWQDEEDDDDESPKKKQKVDNGEEEESESEEQDTEEDVEEEPEEEEQEPEEDNGDADDNEEATVNPEEDNDDNDEDDDEDDSDTKSLGRLTRSDTDSDDDGADTDGAVVGSYGGVLLSTGSWSY